MFNICRYAFGDKKALCIYAYLHIHIYTHIYTHILKYVHTYTHIRTNMHAHIHEIYIKTSVTGSRSYIRVIYKPPSTRTRTCNYLFLRVLQGFRIHNPRANDGGFSGRTRRRPPPTLDHKTRMTSPVSARTWKMRIRRNWISKYGVSWNGRRINHLFHRTHRLALHSEKDVHNGWTEEFRRIALERSQGDI